MSKAMHKHPTSKGPLITSTPRPQGHFSLQANELDDTVLSPITEGPIKKVIPKAEKYNAGRISNVEKVPNAGKRLVQTKRKQPTKVPEKESASAKVLRELNFTKAPNVLSYSFNRFNINPEPIILSSDEEEPKLETSGRKIKESKPSGTIPKDKKISVNKKLNKEGEKVKKLVGGKKCDTIILDSTFDNEIPSRKQKESDLQKIYLGSKCSENYIPTTTGSTDEDDDLFSRIRKKDTKKQSHLMDSQTENNIKKVTKQKPSSKRGYGEDEEEEDRPKTKVSNYPLRLRSREKQRDEEQESHSSNMTVNPSPEELRSQNTLLQDKVFYFTDLVFHRNKRCGGIVASSLETETQKCGFIELEKNGTFTSSTSDMIYLILEGSCAVNMSGKTGHLFSGDVLHVGEFDGGCTFACMSDKARMYFSRSKH